MRVALAATLLLAACSTSSDEDISEVACRTLSQEDCDTRADCMDIEGRTLPDDTGEPCGLGSWLSCAPRSGCDDVLTYASRAPGATCYQLPDSCLPPGWVICEPEVWQVCD